MRAILGYGRFRTLLDLENASDTDLLAIPKFGSLALKQTRQQIRDVRASKASLREEMIAWVDHHKLVVMALMAGEAVIVLKEHISKSENTEQEI